MQYHKPKKADTTTSDEDKLKINWEDKLYRQLCLFMVQLQLLIKARKIEGLTLSG